MTFELDTQLNLLLNSLLVCQNNLPKSSYTVNPVNGKQIHNIFEILIPVSGVIHDIMQCLRLPWHLEFQLLLSNFFLTSWSKIIPSNISVEFSKVGELTPLTAHEWPAHLLMLSHLPGPRNMEQIYRKLRASCTYVISVALLYNKNYFDLVIIQFSYIMLVTHRLYCGEHPIWAECEIQSKLAGIRWIGCFDFCRERSCLKCQSLLIMKFNRLLCEGTICQRIVLASELRKIDHE